MVLHICHICHCLCNMYSNKNIIAWILSHQLNLRGSVRDPEFMCPYRCWVETDGITHYHTHIITDNIIKLS